MGDATEAQAGYRRSVDLLYRDAETGETSRDTSEWRHTLSGVPEAERYSANATRKVRLAARIAEKEHKCRYCWVFTDACYCASLPRIGNSFQKVHWVLLYHHQEFLRATSTGKLVSKCLGAEFLVFGADPHRRRIGELLHDPRVCVLFPHEDSETLPQVLERAAPAASSPGLAPGVSPDAALIVVALDGTWGQARGLFRAISVQYGVTPRCVRLSQAAAFGHESLFNTLRQQSEAGRVCTLEACALLLQEAESLGCASPGGAAALLSAMRHMVDVVANEKRVAAPFGSLTADEVDRSLKAQRKRQVEAEGTTRLQRWGINRQTDVEMERWIEALQEAGRRAPRPAHVRFCCVCNTQLMTSLRLKEHLSGRKHCASVAEAHLGRSRGAPRHRRLKPLVDVEVDAEVAEAVFHKHSTVRLEQYDGHTGAGIHFPRRCDIEELVLRFVAHAPRMAAASRSV
eukprot:TRINITY_DN21655_c0_g1_i1.p1 TRINITY_DN21655_c0_g1~~TRINITY_DN21655_c0_g1_i1.p1  ORF type:complete len:458 (+),score=132.32 TRINITY_DN21655_c0_g1_i1:49-1422(+)